MLVTENITLIVPSSFQIYFLPKKQDSYFSWNFYDSYLQQKEYFSNYVFIDQVAEILKSNPVLKASFEAKKENEPAFKNSEWEQLYYIYSHSPYFEQTFMRLPVYEKHE
jgi:hypothetical protein